MATRTAQSQSLHFDERLAGRLEELSVVPVALHGDGRLELLGDAPDVYRRVVSVPAFRAAVHGEVNKLREQPGEPTAVWPGVYLVSPAARRRRRRPDDDHESPSLAFMLITPEFLISDELRLLCDQHKLDRDGYVSAIDIDELVNAGAVRPVAQSIVWMVDDSNAIIKRGSELQTMSRELGETYEELSLLYKLSTNMTLSVSTENFLVDACRELQEVSGLKWLALRLVDDEPRLHELQGAVFSASLPESAAADLDEIGRALVEHLPADSQPMVVDDVAALNIPKLTGLTKSALVVSLVADDKPVGVLVGGDRQDGEAINTIDSKLCSALANSMSIFLQNVMLYDDVQGMFMGTLTALTAAIDAKDSYTRGHSERVALMSRMLAEAAGLDANTVERVYISGLVHDVGKIGVPEAVLGKPGRLTDEEFALIRLHPEIGAHILQDIRQMQDLIPGVMYHHERWDGKGYPSGKAALDIPLFGRVIGLADAFDAMSSNRTYRSALGHEKVIEEISRCAGTQFDPELAAAFVKLDFKPFFDLIAKHQAADDVNHRKSA